MTRLSRSLARRILQCPGCAERRRKIAALFARLKLHKAGQNDSPSQISERPPPPGPTRSRPP